MKPIKVQNTYNQLLEKIGETFSTAKSNAINAINNELVKAHWQIGKHIVEFEQKGEYKAEYGTQLLENLSADLKIRHGKGFSRSNINYMRLFYIKYPICETVSHKLVK